MLFGITSVEYAFYGRTLAYPWWVTVPGLLVGNSCAMLFWTILDRLFTANDTNADDHSDSKSHTDLDDKN